MKPALLAKQPRYPSSWQDLPVGEDLKAIVETAVEDISRQMFGYHLLKIGHLSAQLSLSQCPIKHKVSVVRDTGIKNSVIAHSHELPFGENSIDAAILINELDFAQDPHQILREVDRIMIPNGQVAIVGFNPFSLAGLMKFLPINPKQILHDARFFSSMRIKDWLSLLGFEVVEHQHLVFSELFFERKVDADSRWQIWCQKYLPIFSSLYVIVAKKRVLPLSLIKPKWKPKPNFSVVGASMREVDSTLLKKNLL